MHGVGAGAAHKGSEGTAHRKEQVRICQVVFDPVAVIAQARYGTPDPKLDLGKKGLLRLRKRRHARAEKAVLTYILFSAKALSASLANIRKDARAAMGTMAVEGKGKGEKG